VDSSFELTGFRQLCGSQAETVTCSTSTSGIPLGGSGLFSLGVSGGGSGGGGGGLPFQPIGFGEQDT
jgi:hypothetical protein